MNIIKPFIILLPLLSLFETQANPSRIWGTYFGGNKSEITRAMAIDGNDNIIIVGETFSDNSLATPGAHQINRANDRDGFIAKLTPTGQLLWATYYGGQEAEWIYDVTVDVDNNIYMAGRSYSSDSIATSGAFDETGPGGFLVKFDENGVRQWGTYFGSYVQSVVLDNNGDLVIAGIGGSSSLATPGTFKQTSSGSSEAFVAKITTDGVRVWGTLFGGPDGDNGKSLAIDNDNNIILVGSTRSLTEIASPGAYYSTGTNQFSAFIVKFDPTGNRIWSTYYGTGEYTDANRVGVDAENNIVFGGVTQCASGIATSGTYETTIPSGQATYYAKFTPDGDRIWGTYIVTNADGSGAEIERLHIDPSGNIYLGDFVHTNVPSRIVGLPTSNAYSTVIPPGYVVGYFMFLNSSGNKTYASFYGGNIYSQISSALIDNNGDLVIAGDTRSDQDMTTPGTYRPVHTNDNSEDAFVVKFSLSCVGPAFTSTINGNTSLCEDDEGESYFINTASGANTYLWKVPQEASITSGQGTNSIQIDFGTVSGDVIVYAQNGCTDIDSSFVTISLQNPPVVNLGNDTTLCLGDDTLTLDAFVSGATYDWSTGAVTSSIDVTTANVYLVEVADGACKRSDAIQVGFDTPPVVDLGNDTTICQGEELNLDAFNSGASYLWSTGAVLSAIDVSTTNMYAVEVARGACIREDTINLSVQVAPVIDLGADTTLCLGDDTLTLDAFVPGAVYDWSTGAMSSSIEVTTANTYGVEVTESFCIVTDTIIINFDTLPVVDLGNDTTICQGEELNLDAFNSGASYLWSTGAVLSAIDVSTANMYAVEVTRGVCVREDTVNLSVQAAPVIDLGADTTLCSGDDTLTLDAFVLGAAYDWSTGATTSSIEVTASNTYAVEVTESFCIVRDTVIVSFDTPPVVDLGNDTTICDGEVLNLDAFLAGATYDWSTGSIQPDINVTTPNMYGVEVTSGACIRTDTIYLSVQTPPVVELGNDTTLCLGDDTLTLDAFVTGATYNWSTGVTSSSIEVITANTYAVEVTESFCVVTDTIIVNFDTPPVVDLGNDTTICQGEVLSLDAFNSGASYLWNTGSVQPSINVSTANTYAVLITRGVCTRDDTVELDNFSLPTVDAGLDTSVFLGGSVQLIACCANLSHLWTPNNDINDNTILNPTVSPQVTTSYILTVTDGNGCINRDTIVIFVDENFSLFVPNAFSPNNDNSNDRFKVYGTGIKILHLSVYNKWGNRVYSSDNVNEILNQGWDGSYNGTAQPTGTYVWKLSGAFVSGEEIALAGENSGTLLLIR